MSKSVIYTDKAPQAIGTYSQAIKSGTTVYLSGQIPLVPETMLVISEDFTEQAHSKMCKLYAMLLAAQPIILQK